MCWALSAEQKEQLKNFQSVLQGFVLTKLDRHTTAGRHPPSETDCKVLTFGEAKKAVVNDLGMHLLAGAFDVPIWHGWKLLSKMPVSRFICAWRCVQTGKASSAPDWAQVPRMPTGTVEAQAAKSW